jgi:tRNA G26 N,N-dimethylase Trm1
MCCGHLAHHGTKPDHGSSCACGMHVGPFFWSKKKKVEMLEQMLEGLQEEAKDIEELLAELKEEK